MRFCSLLFLLLATWPARLEAQQGWEEFQSYDGRFRVLAPGPLQQHVDSVDTALGKLAYHTFFFQPAASDSIDNFLYMVSYCDYPPFTLHADSTELLEEFFQATIESAVESVDGELIYAGLRDCQGYPGRIWRINYLDGQAVIKTRALVAGNRYYALQTATLRKRGLNQATDRFLDSFHLLE